MSKQLFTAIIFCRQKQINGNFFLKYRNISDKDRFIRFAKKFPGAAYINWYSKEKRDFLGRDYL